MESYDVIRHKLSAFITRYYKTRMIRGVFLFLCFGVLFWLGMLTLEYFLWLSPNSRLVLLVLALCATAILLVTYIGFPMLYLFRLKDGLTLKKAAEIIGRHFPGVDDRLVNLLDLAGDSERTELLLASIEQRSRELSPIPFQQAIDLKKSFKYARLLLIPLLAIGGIWISGKISDYIDSLDRVVHYDMAYEKPAPFRFVVLNEPLRTVEKKDFVLKVKTEGEMQPEQALIVINGTKRMMAEAGGQYSFSFTSPEGSQDFYFEANDVRSRTYTLETISPPVIEQFYTVLDYPSYLNRAPDTLKGTGNALIPEGTRVSWKVKAVNTEKVGLTSGDSLFGFGRDQNAFTLRKTLFRDLVYEIKTSNSELQDYERLGYSLRVVKDANPVLDLEEVRDTITNTVEYLGRAQDDYGISELSIVYYEEGKESDSEVLELASPGVKEYAFGYDFPTGLALEKGKSYNYFFRITDNDAIRGGKSIQSRIFRTKVLDDQQERSRQLEEQKEILGNLDRGVEKMKQQEDQLNSIERTQREKKALDYNDQKEIKDFLKSQQQQEAMMEKFTKELRETMNRGQADEYEEKLLKERLERQELEAKKNEQLLRELEELADKIDKQEMAERLEEIGKRQQNSKRNLSQLLELTKRYYVTEKASELSNRLNKLAEKEETLSKINQDQDFNIEEQGKINQDFEEIGKDLQELRKLNEDLKKPFPMDTGEDKEREVKEDLNDALEELKRGDGEESAGKNQAQENNNEAKTKQRQAAAKMRQMSEALQQSAMSGGGESMAEDAEMLRQILDNLLVFSLKQEALLDKLNEENGRNYSVSVIRDEQELRTLFEHVDDSLFTLSLRQVEITEFVNKEITEVYYNIESTLDNMAEGQIYRAAAHQQAVLTSANNLADFLADILSNMQQSLAQGQGSGKSQDGFQLPDIIQGQKEVEGQMQKLGKTGEQQKEGSGEKGKEGEGKSGEGQDNKGGQEDGQGYGGDQDMGELYEIYKQQQMIRQKLEQQLKDMINTQERELAERLTRQMEDFERDLLENGITERTMNKVNRIRQQLMKLENAAMEQGEEEQRKSENPNEEYEQPLIKNREEVLKDEEILEILQRQALPLQEFYGEAVKRYFLKND